MDQDLRLFLIRHGAIVVLLGALSGLGYMFVITGDMSGSMRAWHLAHLQGILTGILIIAGSSYIDYLVVSRIFRTFFLSVCLPIREGWGFDEAPEGHAPLVLRAVTRLPQLVPAADPYSNIVLFPTWCRQYVAAGLPPASGPIGRPGKPPQRAFCALLPA